jgi:hypothetical protein
MPLRFTVMPQPGRWGSEGLIVATSNSGFALTVHHLWRGQRLGDRSFAEQSMVTSRERRRVRGIVGTPDYMSPEQI